MKASSRAWEFLGLVAVTVIGAVLIPIESWIYGTGTISVTGVRIPTFIRDMFTPSALIVFAISVIFAMLWWAVATFKFYSAHPRGDSTAKLIWWLFALAPVLSIGVALYLYGKISPQAVPSMAVFLVFNMLLNYWLATAVSTPSLIAHVVPLARLWRK